MKKFFLFLLLFFLFFAAGFFLDVVFRGRGALTNVILLWFFIFASYWLLPHEILYAGWLMGLTQSFFAAGPVWFWFFVFFAASFVMMAVRGLAGASGRFQFFFFALAGWAGTLLFRMIALFFPGAARTVYGMVWDYVFSPAFGWEIALSAALLCCIAVAAYGVERKERTYYV